MKKANIKFYPKGVGLATGILISSLIGLTIGELRRGMIIGSIIGIIIEFILIEIAKKKNIKEIKTKE